MTVKNRLNKTEISGTLEYLTNFPLLLSLIISISKYLLFLITGPPMIGKSRLAREVLKLKRENHNKHYVLNLTGKDHPNAILNEFSALSSKQITNEEDFCSFFKKDSGDQNAVIVFDNCDDLLHEPDSKTSFMCLCNALVSLKNNIQLMITSTLKLLFPRQKPDDVYIHDVKPLKLKESIQLFEAVCPRPDIDDDLKVMLLQRLGGLPYPIIIVASQLKLGEDDANDLIESFLETFPYSPNDTFSFDDVLSIIKVGVRIMSAHRK